ncbi:MFS transporter [Nostocaceae cyanobacterium CENA357]|uniref:MFS transporter n=1 Tax=Atlanticothrix silvestris CENA357 TaxID=1725252 RepID=A0A8J7L2B4_9CYAN|nr:MFS transporter [Atlanticothrix silvestris]MBH8551612.1 MFS transporter [Atlanticothrix silvestris CENA357]
MVNSFNTRPEILWRQVWGLAALLAAIIFSWMVYGFYQPKILQQLEFVELASWLGIVQGLLAAFIEPLIGGISDRIQQRIGSRLPMISVGVVLAGLIFVTVSLLAKQNFPVGTRWIVPVLMNAWVIAMISFRGPAIALLIQFAPITELPQANAILMFVFGLVAAIGSMGNTLLYSMGASITFLLGAIALVLGAYILRLFTPRHFFDPSTLNQDISADAPNLLLILIFVISLAAGIEVNLLLSVFPQELQTQLPGLQVEFIVSEILLVSAIASVTLGEWTAELGADKSMLIGLGTMTGLMGLTILNENNIIAIGLILGFGVSFSLLFISMISLVLSKIPYIQAGLGTGLYFGGTAGGTAIVSLLMKQVGITSIGAFLLAEFTFVIAIVGILLTKKISVAQVN